MEVADDDFDLVAGGRPFLSLVVVCFWRDAAVVAFAFAGDFLLLLLLLFWRAFVCRPVDFVGGGVTVSSGVSGGTIKDKLNDDEWALTGDIDDLRVETSSTCIGCGSWPWLSVTDVVDWKDNCSRDERPGVFDIGDRIEVVRDTSVFVIVDTCLSFDGILPFIVLDISLSVVSSNKEKVFINKKKLIFKLTFIYSRWRGYFGRSFD